MESSQLRLFFWKCSSDAEWKRTVKGEVRDKMHSLLLDVFSIKHVNNTNVRKQTQSYVTEILEGAVIKTSEYFKIDNN